MNEQQLQHLEQGQGFIAALDQSGGSSPRALLSYGITNDAYSNETEMFEHIHQMRSRIITSPAFNGSRLSGAILFEDTMNSQIEGQGAANYIWEVKGVVPFIKIDVGLEPEEGQMQLMKPIPEMENRLQVALENGMFGTKMRSVINAASHDGIKSIAAQQFEVGNQILESGLVPILEPEVTISIPDKQQAEEMLLAEIMEHLGDLQVGKMIMFKLSIPTQEGFYSDLIAHPAVLKVVALSGGYSQEESVRRLAAQPGMSASFSRAFLEGLRADQTDEEFNQVLDRSIEAIYQASIT